MNFKPLANPLLIISDAPELLTGLGRIGRDLASLACTLPQFRVGYMGLGGHGRRSFAWAQYFFPEDGQFGSNYISHVWTDFAGKDDGIILSLWDLSRMLWFGQPQTNNAALAKFLGPGRNFSKWGYVPVDGTGPDEVSLPAGMVAAAAGYDRLLAASEWGANVMRKSGIGADWIPHGIWTNVFEPKKDSRKMLDWPEDAVAIGCNMTNQSRKDWAVAFECAALLKKHYGNRFKFWVHTDVMIRYWNLYGLASDYGVADCLEVTIDKTDEQLAVLYSACDCTMLPSGGEGFGYPVAESMACGTPCVVPDYAAAQELVSLDAKVPVVTHKVDTSHNVRRAVLSGYSFASCSIGMIEAKRNDPVGTAEKMRARVSHLNWEKLKPVWTKWLLEGLK